MIEVLIVAILVGCFAAIWVTELTKLDGGLLWFIPKVYPYPERFMGKVLRCSICLAGWLALFILPVVAYFYDGYIICFPAVFLSMSTAKIISK
jgi:hypothetical protein